MNSLARLVPGRWPIRWRVAAVSAALTLIILAAFAIAVGQLADDRLRTDFRDELRAAAGELAFSLQVQSDATGPVVIGPDLEQVAMTDHARVRVVMADGSIISATSEAPDLGMPRPGVSRVGQLEVATAQILSSRIDLPTVYVQYARHLADVEDTINRLWLFLLSGALGGTLLAAVGSVMVAGRALAPITRLTSVAREVGTRRDPSLQLPIPEAEDEVADLARTLDRMLAELDIARADTQGALARQRQFVADASHELRTPLTSILANLEMLVDERHGVSDPEAREAAQSALRSASRMNALVGDLLVLARAESGRSSAKTECDLSEVCREALGEAEPLCVDHRLDADIAGDVIVNGNPFELHRIVSNLLGNAMTHTPAGSRIELRLVREDSSAVITVSDDGPGVPTELRGSVFDRFVHGASRADCEGTDDTGIGLAIVRAVAQDHGGVVAVGDSEIGGAHFEVRLPLVA